MSLFITPLAQEWVVPQGIWYRGFHSSGLPIPYGDTVAIETNVGWLILVERQKVTDGAGLEYERRVAVKLEDLKKPYEGLNPEEWSNHYEK